MRERNRLYTLKLKDRLTPGEAERLGILTTEVCHIRCGLKKTFFAKQLSEAGKNSRAAWRVLHNFIGKAGRKGSSRCRSFTHDGGIITGDSFAEVIAESFCEYFTNIGPKLAREVGPPASGSFLDFLGLPSGPSAFFCPTTPGEIESICQALDGSKGPGHDGFSPAVLRFVSSGQCMPGSGPLSRFLEGG